MRFPLKVVTLRETDFLLRELHPGFAGGSSAFPLPEKCPSFRVQAEEVSDSPYKGIDLSKHSSLKFLKSYFQGENCMIFGHFFRWYVDFLCFLTI